MKPRTVVGWQRVGINLNRRIMPRSANNLNSLLHTLSQLLLRQLAMDMLAAFLNES
jgi:hypothetical protein